MNFLRGKKFSKFRKGRNKGIKIEKKIQCDYYIYSNENSIIKKNQIESVRKVINKFVKNNGRIIIKIYPDTPITKKPIEVRMGSGKGEIYEYIYKVKKGCILFEYDCEDIKIAKRIFYLASNKIPFKTKLGIKNE